MGLMPLNPEPLILGHRGASAVAPENTLAAFSRAIDEGADGIEFDVRLARDHVPVVIHDATLRRTGLIERMVGELTSRELQAIDVGSWFRSYAASGASYAGEKIPLLAQVFELFAAREGLLFVEMKCGGTEGDALAAQVVKIIGNYKIIERVVVASFDLSAIAEVKRLDASVRTAALFEPRLSRPLSVVTTARQFRMVDLARQHGADQIALHHSLAHPQLTEKARNERLEIVVWTVDDRKWIERARAQDVRTLIANNPGRMMQARNEETY